MDLPSEGFVVVPAIDPSTVADLRGTIDALGIDPGHEYFASNVHLDRSETRRIDQLLKECIAPFLAPYVGEMQPFLAAVISKGARSGARVEFHQDWTYTDEREDRALLFWIPLVDVGMRNGCMQMVPGSHRWTDGIRPSGAPAPSGSKQRELADLSTPVPMSAGQAVMYDPALLHGSVPNPSPIERPAVAIAFAPRDAALVHFHLEDDGSMSGAVVDEAFFSTAEFGRRPEGYPPIAAWAEPVSEGVLQIPAPPRRVERRAALRSRWRRARSRSAMDDR